VKPADFPLGSAESRAAARAQLERAKREPGEVIRVQIVYIGHDKKEPLPPPERIPWKGGVTEMIWVAGEDE
jgi:hypothetical protein